MILESLRAPMSVKSPTSLLFSINYIDNFLPNVSYSIISTHPLVGRQTFHKSFFSEFKKCPADCRAFYIQLFGKICRRIGFGECLEYFFPDTPPANKTYQVIHLVKVGKNA